MGSREAEGQGVTGRCCCTGVAHLKAIRWASYGVETQREVSARFLTWRDHPSLKEVVEPFWSPFSLVSCSEEFGNSSLDTSALSLLFASNSKPSFSGAICEPPINLPVHPPMLNAPTIVDFPGREETKHFILRKLFTACQPQATVEKDLFLPRSFQELNP
ncbi:hypothetical protein CRENBAI_004861 [Crenichthys baileyi]|uniref:Uncharacterized protein n=1 Tax=Crenichthys baileyi TaxID=28760 RepID=A0AAV9RN64_9TELE